MEPLRRDAALLIIDVQQGFDEPALGRRNNPRAEGNIARLLAAWRDSGRPVFHVQHLSPEPGAPPRLGQPRVEINGDRAPARGRAGDPQARQQRLHRHRSGGPAPAGGDRRSRHRRADDRSLRLDHGAHGGQPRVPHLPGRRRDATFDRVGPGGRRHRAEAVHAISLASLHGEFATVVDTAVVLRSIGEGPVAGAPAASPGQ